MTWALLTASLTLACLILVGLWVLHRAAERAHERDAQAFEAQVEAARKQSLRVMRCDPDEWGFRWTE